MQIKTFTYTKKSGQYYLELPDRYLHMDSHVTSLLSEGWEPINSANDPGHVRVGKTLVVAGLTGGLSLLFGGSRSANTITLTFKKTNSPGGYCVSCGNPLLGDGGFCSKCGARSKGATTALSDSETPGNIEPCRCKQCGAAVGEGISYCCECRSKSTS